MLEGLYVQDLDKDTLLLSPRFTVDMNYFSLKERRIDINTVQMDDGKFYLKTYKNGKTNLQFIINYFNTGKTTPPKTPKRKYDLMVDKIVLNNIDFRYKNFNRISILKRINFDDLHLQNVNTIVSGINTKNHQFQGNIQNLNFREKSGFKLKNLSTIASVDSNRLELKNLILQTPQSQITDYVLLRYNNYSDLNKFVDKVYIKTNLKYTYIHSKDLGYFADNLPPNLELKVKGNINGYVHNLKARNFTASAGQATYIKGDFDIKGLSTNKGISLNLKIDHLHSNKKDADRLAKLINGKSNQVPAIVGKFGNITFGGNIFTTIRQYRVDGKLKSALDKVDLAGQLKTALGRVNTNAKVVFNGEPKYSGIVKAYDFNLGELLDRKDLGRTTLTASINGRGFSVKKLEENINANISYIDYKGYRYTNVDVNGHYNKNFFNGKIDVADRNLNLRFLGGIDFTSKLPSFNFNATLRNTNLNRLGFAKDTIQIDADFHTAFTGSNLNNIQGRLELRKIRVTTPSHSMVIDSVYVAARGVGNARSLTINSDILDAGIKGQYDLNTLPYYFTSVIKQYVPSLKVKTGNRGVQNFDFTLNLKYFDPISAIFIPKLKIPEGAEFRGHFASSENVANLSGSSSLIEYGNIKISNVIIDEGTTQKQLNLFVTSDRVDLSDSLYIKNVNVANIFHNDSLSFNVKLSDKDAVNQLDLNGLVEFDTKNFASVSLLPSDVVINSEVWRIPEQVQLDYNKGKFMIKDFALFRDNQYLTLDGIVSNDFNDKLNVGFKQFNLATFNPITKGRKVTLGGELNGSIILSSVLKKPKLESDLLVDSLVMNNIPIGELTLVANLDNNTKLVDLVLNVQKNGKETVNIAGNYNANTDKNLLNLDLVMDDSELIVFQPFIKHLVSNISGTVTADMKITGTVFNPHINGRARLKKANMVVNYTKVPYGIDDEVRINNSIIYLDDLELTDNKNNRATATGTVDLQNIKYPNLNIVIDAPRPFMALNTTAKDNALYYGTAYGIGRYEFKGPTNNMRILIDAETQEGTVFNIPLNAAEKVSGGDLITFVAKDSSLVPKKAPSFNGLEMTLKLRVNDQSVVNIYTDLGKLSGRGSSDELSMTITKQGEFQMFGRYLITSGEFQYTAQEYISKIFDITSGGSIRWNRDPVEAEINLSAVYGRRANIAPLYRAAGFEGPDYNRTVFAEAVMILTGRLTSPQINLDLNFPQEPNIKVELQSYLSDVNNRNQQALSFVARQTFASNTGGLNVQAVNATIVNAVTEVTFNQINNILAQTFGLRTVDLNVRSLNDASATVRFFGNRLVITGGISDRRANVNAFDVLGSNYSTDVEAQLILKKDYTGSLILRGYNRPSNRLAFASSTQNNISAIGLVYRKDFDTLGEFLRAILGRRREDEKEEEKPQTPAPVNTNPSITFTPSDRNGSKKDSDK